MSFHIKYRYPLYILSAVLIGAGFYFLNQYIQVKDSININSEPPAVGYKAKPDSAGWRLLFNGKNLEGWKITNFGPQGPVSADKSKKAIVLGMGDGCTGVTWQKKFPKANYEIALDARRVKGIDFFCGLTFPVKNEFCTLIVGGWGGTVVGISSINGKDASENFTKQLMTFEKEKWYHLRVQVTQDSINAFIDKDKVIEVPIDRYSFSVRPEVSLSRPLGICSWMTAAELKNIKFRIIEECQKK
jgi:hypothetical protein